MRSEAREDGVMITEDRQPWRTGGTDFWEDKQELLTAKFRIAPIVKQAPDIRIQMILIFFPIARNTMTSKERSWVG